MPEAGMPQMGQHPCGRNVVQVLQTNQERGIMTRQEEIINAAYNEAEVERQLKMHPQVFEQGFVAGAKWADRTMIDKACELLYEYNRNQTDKMFGTGLHTADVTINVAQFRKAMEGGGE